MWVNVTVVLRGEAGTGAFGTSIFSFTQVAATKAQQSDSVIKILWAQHCWAGGVCLELREGKRTNPLFSILHGQKLNLPCVRTELTLPEQLLSGRAGFTAHDFHPKECSPSLC